MKEIIFIIILDMILIYNMYKCIIEVIDSDFKYIHKKILIYTHLILSAILLVETLVLIVVRSVF